MSWIMDAAERWLAPKTLFPPRRGEDLEHYFARVRPKIAASPGLLAQPFALREDDKRQPQHFSEMPLHWIYARAADEMANAEAARDAARQERAANGDMDPEEPLDESEAPGAPAQPALGFWESHFLDWVSLASNVDEVVSNRWGDPRWEERSFYPRDTRRLLALAVGDDTFMAPASWVKALLDAGADVSAQTVGTAAPLFRALWRYNDPAREGRWSDSPEVVRLILDRGADPWKEAELDAQSASSAGRVWMIANQLKGEGKSLAPMSLINTEPNIAPGVREAILAWVRKDFDAAIGSASAGAGAGAKTLDQALGPGASAHGESAGAGERPRRSPRRL